MRAKQIRKLPSLVPLGKTANFYVPAAKVNAVQFGRDGKTPKQLFEEFFVSNFGGLTHEESQIQGRWVGSGDSKVFSDRHERYEVSFAGKRKAAEFFAFLADMCRLLEEGSIYVTYGAHSYLVEAAQPLVQPPAEHDDQGADS